MRAWIGLDVGESQTQLCALDATGSVLAESYVKSDAADIAAAIEAIPTAEVQQIALEAGLGRRLALRLRSDGYAVNVIDTRKARRFLSIRHHKTDKNDARGLAELAMLGLGEIKTVHIKSLETQQLRSELVLRNQIVKQKTALQAAIRSLLVEHGIVLKLPASTKLRATVQTAVQQYAGEGRAELIARITPLLDIREAMREYIDAADRRLKAIATNNPVTSAFMGVPGVGFVCAISFYTAIDDPHRFRRAADVGAYLGMVPIVIQSGGSVRRARITKAGSRLTRSHLVVASRVIVGKSQQKSALTDWSRNLTARIGYPRAKVAIARKIAVLLLAMWKSGKPFVPYPPANQLPTGGADLDTGHMSGALTQNQEAVPSLS